MIQQRMMKKVATDNPKQVAGLIDIVNLPQVLRDFMGQSQSSQLSCFRRVWDYIKEKNLQDTIDKNAVNCDQKLKSIFLGKSRFNLVELPLMVKVLFPKKSR